ncbi:MAG: hypothetical protein K9N10_14905 [Deltaproteobacteria bacterium]|nr:hypothetical protein [Deltaproteobacteria bacterium]
MVSGSEMRALKTVVKENGETTTRLVCRQLGIDSSYATVLCTSLLRSEHLARETRGRFKITPKGKKALGWSGEDTLFEVECGNPFKKIQREEFQWRSFSMGRVNAKPMENGFFKPGQEDVAWSTLDYGNSSRPGRINGRAQTYLITEKTHTCGFCRGTGKKAKGVCPVCRGTGSVGIVPPAVSCAYCSGKGVERRSGRVCPVCRGKGVVSVHPPVGVCGQCRGSGAEQGTRLTCLKCGGKGVLHLRETATNRHNGKNRGIN